MPNFTLILEFRGGTYIRQVRAASPQGALRKVASSTDAKTEVFRALAHEKVIAIDGIANCWCLCATHRGKFALLNIVETA